VFDRRAATALIAELGLNCSGRSRPTSTPTT
jgi:hypothetical protein